jgi:hypothetical protein
LAWNLAKHVALVKLWKMAKLLKLEMKALVVGLKSQEPIGADCA